MKYLVSLPWNTDGWTPEPMKACLKLPGLSRQSKNVRDPKVACIEEIAFEMGYIDAEQLLKLAEPLKKNQYGQYLIARANEEK